MKIKEKIMLKVTSKGAEIAKEVMDTINSGMKFAVKI